MDALPRDWERTFALVMATTGCRIGEAAALTWEDIDLARQTVRLSGKTGSRTVVVPPELVDWLRKLGPNGSGRLYGISPKSAVHAFTADLKALPWEDLGISRFTSHGIRRMVVDAYYAAGADIGVVAQQLGQSPAVALRYYRQATDEQRAQAVALAGLGQREEPNVVALRRPPTGSEGT